MKCKKEDLVYKSDVLQIVQVDKKELWERRSLQEIYKKKLRELQPITETEIRNKAIGEFAEKLKDSLMNNYKHFLKRDTDGFDWLTTDAVETHIDEIAEQLKGARE